MRRLTNKQRAWAQFLHSTWTNAQRISDEVDPSRSITTHYDVIASHACQEFIALVGAHPHDIRFTDLATDEVKP